MEDCVRHEIEHNERAGSRKWGLARFFVQKKRLFDTISIKMCKFAQKLCRLYNG